MTAGPPAHAEAPTGGELRVGLIGFGLAGSSFHAPLIHATKGLRLTAVVTADAQRARQAKATYPRAVVFGTADPLWAAPSPVDVVVIATPNRTHAPLARAALAAGRHVVVDKPFTPTAAEGRALIEDARARGLVLTVFQNRRWDGDFLTVRRLLAEEALGQLFRFESRFERWRPTPKAGWRQRPDPEEAGGVLYDLGSHLIDQALELLGPARAVYAELDPRHPGAEVDEDAFVALTHASGVRSHIWASALAAQPGPRLRLLGSRAGYTKYGLDVQEEVLRSGGGPSTPGWGEESRDRWGLLGADHDLRPVPTARGCYECFYAGVAAAVRDGAPPPVDPAGAVAGLEVIEAARRSAAAGEMVALGG